MTGMIEMKPCPFCGKKGIVIDKSDKLHNRFYPSCTDRNCLGRNKHKYFPSDRIATLAWNRRGGEHE